MIRFVRLLEVHLMTITNFILEKKKKKQLQIQGIRTVKCTWMANESARSANAKEREKCTTVHNHTLSFETIHVICFVFSFFFRSPKSISNEEISFSILTILVKSTFSNVITWTEPKDASRFLCLFHIDFWFLSNDYIVMWVFGWHDHKIAGCAGETDMLLWHGLSLACEIETLNESNHFYFRHICQFMARGRLLLPLFFCLFATPIVSILFRIRFALDVFVFLDLQRKTCSFRCDWMRVHQLFLCFFFRSIFMHMFQVEREIDAFGERSTTKRVQVNVSVDVCLKWHTLMRGSVRKQITDCTFDEFDLYGLFTDNNCIAF